jgi:WD40 repeat protein
MTQHKHFKALVRARMTRTGERYATARRHVLASLGTSVHLELEQEFRAHARHAIAVAFTPDGDELLSGGFGGEATIWSSADGSRRGELRGHERSVNGFAFDRDGTHVATVSSDATARVWELASRRCVATIRGHGKGAVAIDVMPDGTVATGGYDGTIRRWSASGEELGRVRIGARAVALAAHPSEPWIAASAGDAEVQVVDGNGEPVARLPVDDVASSIRWSPDGSSLVAGTCAGVHAWATEGWDQIRRIPLGRADASVVPVAIAPDGTLLAAGWAHHVGVWRADRDDPAVTIDGLPKGVYGLAFAPDGSKLAQCGADGVVRVWRVDRRGA